jgi:hypothetical protein
MWLKTPDVSGKGNYKAGEEKLLSALCGNNLQSFTFGERDVPACDIADVVAS